MKHFTVATISTLALLVGAPALAAGNNEAATEQRGYSNTLDLTQSGKYNTVTVEQSGSRNAFDGDQTDGSRNLIDLTQEGRYNYAASGQAGSRNATTTINQDTARTAPRDAGHFAVTQQDDTKNSEIEVKQVGQSQIAVATQADDTRNNSKIVIDQSLTTNEAYASQWNVSGSTMYVG